MADYETTEGACYITYLYRDMGCNDTTAAAHLGISRRTLHNWKKKSKIIATAIEIGKATVDTRVENALLTQALKGDVRACEIWLRNRKPDKWREKKELDINGDMDFKIVVDYGEDD